MKHYTPRPSWIWALGWLALWACSTESASSQGATSDTIRPRAELLAEFRDGMNQPAALDSGAPSRDLLVEEWVSAVAAADTATVRRLMLSRAEFAWLFYPTTPQGLPPYDLPPALMWNMLTRQSAGGMSYVFRRWSGKAVELEGYDCGAAPAAEGENLIHGPCVVRVTVDGRDTVAARLTGPIIERAGAFKFVSYTNDLD